MCLGFHLQAPSNAPIYISPARSQQSNKLQTMGSRRVSNKWHFSALAAFWCPVWLHFLLAGQLGLAWLQYKHIIMLHRVIYSGSNDQQCTHQSERVLVEASVGASSSMHIISRSIAQLVHRLREHQLVHWLEQQLEHCCEECKRFSFSVHQLVHCLVGASVRVGALVDQQWRHQSPKEYCHTK